MSDEGVREFVNRYLPSYDAYLPALYEKGPANAKPGKVLYIDVNEHRALVAASTK